MATRAKQLGDKFKATGCPNVYFQPPETLQIEYPCIIYVRSNVWSRHADNQPYRNLTRYNVTLIHKDPDNPFVSKLMEMPKVTYDRHYTADNLHHDVFQIYY